MTINIELYYYLGNKINDFINKYKNKYNKINGKKITIKKESIIKEKTKLLKEYGNDDFQNSYFKLLFLVEIGNIRLS